ncbi:MAG: ATP-grasp domain-containing protein [Conexivisphaera sp.]
MSRRPIGVEPRRSMVDEATSYARELEPRLEPLDHLDPGDPFIYVSVGGGELGDLVLTAAKRSLGGRGGGILTAAIDRYPGFPAQDVADAHAVLDMMNGDALESAISGFVGDPRRTRHAVFLEVEAVDTARVFDMSRRGYNVVSTPYGPLIGMDRLASKLLISGLGVPAVDWRYAGSAEELRSAADELGLPVIVKPVMTSSGHGTSVVTDADELDAAYEHALRHARGRGDEVIVERYLPELRERGIELTQLVIRGFDEDGRLRTSVLSVGHMRPGAVYVESWIPSGAPASLEAEGAEHAKRIADALGGLGIYAVEQFVVDGKVYTSEFANRPHDTGMVTRWALTEDEGSLHLRSTMGLRIQLPRIVDIGSTCVARVVLAPEDVAPGSPVISWDPSAAYSILAGMGVRGDVWFFGKPTAYPGRRMGLAAACSPSLRTARDAAARAAAAVEEGIRYGAPHG